MLRVSSLFCICWLGLVASVPTNLVLNKETVLPVTAVKAGMNIDPYNPAGNPSHDDIVKLGATMVRVEFKVYSSLDAAFQFYDPLVRNFAAGSPVVQVLFTLDYTTLGGVPPLGASAQDWDNYSQKFAAVCAQIGQHYSNYGENVAYEIWNEPDFAQPSQAYNPSVPAVSYGSMLKQVYQAMHPVIGNAKIVMGGLCSGDPSYLEKVNNNGAGLWVDAVGFHPYGRRPDADWPSSTWGFGTLTNSIAAYEAMLDKLSPRKIPLWITEYGTDDRTAQQQLPLHAFDSINDNQESARVPVLIWFCWSDGMVVPFGVVDAKGQQKPSYASFQQYALKYNNMTKSHH